MGEQRLMVVVVKKGVELTVVLRGRPQPQKIHQRGGLGGCSRVVTLHHARSGEENPLQFIDAGRGSKGPPAGAGSGPASRSPYFSRSLHSLAARLAACLSL